VIRDLELTDAESIADCLETVVLGDHRVSVSVDELLSIALEDLDIGQGPAGFALRTMRRRQDSLGTAYPFDVSELAVRRSTDPAASTYVSLLHLSSGSVARQTVRPNSTSELEVLFERIVAEACAALWGSSGRAVRFGWPSDDGRPQDFPGAIDWLATTMQIETGRGYRPPTRKDGGVDVVSWHEFPDRRAGVPLMLVQCTLQADVKQKTRDIETRVWSNWLSMDVDPLSALAVPQTIGSKNQWNEMSVRTLILDRIRLASLLPAPRTTDVTWTHDTAAQLRQLMEEYR
jgi:hypothetical protein